MTLFVLDASVALEIFVKSPLGERIGHRVLVEQLHAPHLIDVEFLNGLRRLVLRGRLDSAGAAYAFDRLRFWRVYRHEHRPLINRIWQLRNAISAYDACYVALAETLQAPLFTCDGKLARSHGHGAKIVLLS